MSKLVNDCTNNFYRLVAQNDMVETKKKLVVMYLNSTKRSIQEVLCLQSLWTVSKAYKRVLTIEKSQAARNIIEAVGMTITRGLPPHNLGQLSKIKKTKKTMGHGSGFKIHCFRCGEVLGLWVCCSGFLAQLGIHGVLVQYCKGS
jgi:hypothetical protein